MRQTRCFWAIAALLVGTACAGVKSLDEEPVSLAPEESALVRAQIERALSDDEKEWVAAWNQEVQIGAARERLERIALAALRDESGDAEDMFAELRRKWGGLTAASRAKVNAIVERAIAKEDWDRALELEVVSADAADRPAFKAAWEVYRRAPADEATDLFDAIQAARDEVAKETAESD